MCSKVFTSMTGSKRYFFGLLAIAGVVTALFAIGLSPAKSSAQASVCLFTGYAWSDTIGWVSLSGPGYGLKIGDGGAVTGYGWSDNIGWIQAGGLSGFPSGSGTVSDNAKVSGTSITGWLKALAGGTSQSGGWDGWISLSGTSPTYGLQMASDGIMSGYAWGSDVMGWVDFSAATCTINPIICSSGDQYLSGGQCVCIVDPSIVATSTMAGICPTICPSSDQTYDALTHQCRCNVDDSLPANNPGHVCPLVCTPAFFCTDAGGTGVGDYVTQRDASCTETTSPNACPYGCTTGTCQSPIPTGTLRASPAVVIAGQTTYIAWSAKGVVANSCRISGNGESWGGSSSGSVGDDACTSDATCASSSLCLDHHCVPTKTTKQINSKTSYALTCTGLNGATLRKSINITIAPTFVEPH